MKTCMDSFADFVQWGSNGGGGSVPEPNSNFLNSHGKVAEHRPPTPRHPPPGNFSGSVHGSMIWNSRVSSKHIIISSI